MNWGYDFTQVGTWLHLILNIELGDATFRTRKILSR